MKRHRLLTLAVLAIGIAAVALLGGLVRGGGLAAGASSAKGKRADRVCNQESLKGTYASHVTGAIYNAGAEVADIAGVTVTTADGEGHLTGHGWTSTNGTPVAQTVTGTYTINPDCSGTAHFVFTPGQPANAFIVLADHGRIVNLVETDPGTVISGQVIQQ